MARHKVVASFWEEPSPGAPSGYIRHPHGAVIDVPDAEVERLLRIGAIAPVEPDEDADEDTGDATGADDPGSSPAVPDAPADVAAEPADNTEAHRHADPAPVQRPKQTASKPAWVEYAVYRGIDRDEAEATEKRDLIAAIDALN